MKGKKFRKGGYIVQALFSGTIMKPFGFVNFHGASSSMKMMNLSGKIWWRVKNGIFCKSCKKVV